MRKLALAIPLLALLSGCGLRDPSLSRTGPTPTTQTTHTPMIPSTATSPATPTIPARSTIPATPTTPPPTPAGALSAPDALSRFATAWIGWADGGETAERATMIALATGPLRSQLQTTPEPAATGGGGNYIGAIRRPDGDFLVLTEELSGAAGQAQYGVYLATVGHVATGWKLSAWSPENS